jgi:hydrophobe/amphiphile efflux-1 (HAE1) family protein
MNIATWSIRNPIPSIMLFVMLSIAGVIGFRALAIQDFPEIDLPVVTASLRLPGAAPSPLEREVARPVEDSLATLEGLRHITTTIRDGEVQFSVEFVLEKKLSDALLDVKDAIDRVRQELPADLEQPQVTKVTIAGAPIVSYSVSSQRMDEEALSWFVDDTVAKRILAVPGVGRFERAGGVQREVRIEVDPSRLDALGVTAADVSRALRQVQQEAPGGRGKLGGAEQSVRTMLTVRHAEELAAIPIALADGRAVRLDQVARVQDTIAERSQAALFDGEPVVAFRIYRAKGADETEIFKAVNAVLADLQASEPGLSVEELSGTVGETLAQYHGSMQLLLEGALLAVLVVWWFLRDWRATLVSATALPLSILPAFAAMALLGYALNTITLLALAVVVGILVDDAIVEIENIERHRRMGKPPLQAAGDAATEIALAVIATTMTLVAVFAPTAFMTGVPGLVFRQFGWTAVIAVLASLLVARLLTPMMAAYLLKATPTDAHRGDSALMSWYLRCVRWCLAHRRTTLVAATAFFIGSLALVPLLPTGFIPAQDTGFSTINVELPPGSSLQTTIQAAERARAAIAGVDGVDGVFTVAGATTGAQHSGGGGGLDRRKATLTVRLVDRNKRAKQQVIENAIRERLEQVPGARFSIGAGSPGEKLQLVLASDDPTALRNSARALESQLRDFPYLSNINSTLSLERSEIVIRPDAARAAELGVSTQTIADTVRIATSGDVDAALAKLNLDERQIDIRVQMPDSARADLATIANLRVPAQGGAAVPLASLASVTVESGPSQIDRFDRRRNVTITADLGGYPLGDAFAAVKQLPALQALPAQVSLQESGDAELMNELFGSFGLAMGIGILCVYCVLVLLFHDFVQPLTILSALPLSLGGAFAILLASGSELSLPALIGLVMLMGVVTKNSILLVDYAVEAMRQEGLDSVEAMVEACHKRAQPILMTTLAMSAGMLPLALGFGPDASFRQPMALAVIGGLTTSTALSLLVVPAVFAGVNHLMQRLRTWRTGLAKLAPV